MLNSVFTRCRVPKDLAPVTFIASDTESPERDAGLEPGARDRIWASVERLYRSGVHPAIQICLRRHGRVVLNRSIGHAAGNGPADPPATPKVLATTETPFCIFSASKAITAMVAHLLDERRLIHIDDPICEYIPEYARKGKHGITIRHVLVHRAGVPNLPPEAMNLDVLDDPERILELLCDAEPQWRPGRILAYHAITGGFIIGELVRRVTGRDIRSFFRSEVLEPLGFRWMNWGVDPRDVDQVARNEFTGFPVLPPLSNLLERALGAAFGEVTRLSNDRRFLTGTIPAANTITTAEELSRFYQLLLNEGELDGIRIFDPRTVRRARSEQSYLEVDFTLGFPVRYGMGFMLGAKTLSLYGPDTEHAFGHLGFTNVISWADPERDLAGTIMTSGKPAFYPQLVYLWDILRQIGLGCPKDRAFRPAPHAVAE